MSRHLAWLLMLLGSGQAVPQSAGSRPVYSSERYDEDWSSMKDLAQRRDPLDPLKYISLGRDNWYATLAGEARIRYEILDQPGFGRGPEDNNGYLLQRYLLSSDLHLGGHIRVFTELQSALANGRNGGPRFTDLNRLDVGQAFIDLSARDSRGSQFTVRLGRQELGFGTGRLISAAEALNVRRSFDGVRLTWQRNQWVFNAVALKLTDARGGLFDDRPDRSQTFWGGGSIGPHPIWKKANISLYYLGLDKANAAFASGIGRQIRHTVGSRSWKRVGPWDLNYEAIVQWGSFSGRSIRAWALASDTGYTLTGTRKLRLGFRSDITSGDRDPKDRRLNSFDPLFASAVAYSGNAGLIGPVNLIDATPSVRFLLRKNLTLSADSPFYWRQSLNDGIYTVFVTVLRTGTQSKARFVGAAPNISSTWQLNTHTALTMSYSRFVLGRFIRESPPNRDVNYFALSATWRF